MPKVNIELTKQQIDYILLETKNYSETLSSIESPVLNRIYNEILKETVRKFKLEELRFLILFNKNRYLDYSNIKDMHELKGGAIEISHINNKESREKYGFNITRLVNALIQIGDVQELCLHIWVNSYWNNTDISIEEYINKFEVYPSHLRGII